MTTGEKKRVARIQGRYNLDLTSHVIDKPDIKWDWLIADLEDDAPEHRLRSIEEWKLAPLADAKDIAEWDIDVINKVHPPMYSRPKGQSDQQAAVENLKEVLQGCATQMAVARRAYDWALNKYGKDKKTSFGSEMDALDATFFSLTAGFHPWSMERIGAGLAYAEDQIKKITAVANEGKASVAELESNAMHAATMLLVAQEVIELIKVSCLSFTSAGNLSLADVAWYPLPIWTGRGMMEKGKKAVVFVGDDFIPMYQFVERLKAAGATEKHEVCGIGQAADDLPRFYDRGRWVGPMVRAKKVLRTGAFDLVVGSDNCMTLDLAGEAKRTGSRFIWTGTEGVGGLKDRSGDAADAVAREVIGGSDAWVKDPEKAAEVVQKVLEGLEERKGSYVMDEAKAKAEAGKCRENCDLCTYACPNGVMVSRGVRAVKKGEGLKALAELEKKCCLYGECDKACPEKVSISGMMVSAFAQKAANDKFLFRGGRAGATRGEAAANDYTSTTGNCPGWYGIIGCGRANPDEVQWIANEIASRNGIVAMAGCAVGDMAHYCDPEEKKWLAEKYAFWLQPRSAANYGGCSACQFLPPVILKNARSGAGVTSYGNYVETVATTFDRFACNTIVWGALPDRMFSIASGIARTGAGVVVGPITGLDWRRLMPGNKWDWSRYWVYEALGQGRKFVEPSPEHLIIPVETKEEAVVMACCLNVRPAQGFRTGFLEGWLDTHRAYFGELPDNWHRFVRSPSDLPIASKMRLLADLAANHGWEVQGIVAKSIPHPDGRMLDQREYVKDYGAAGSPSTRVPRLRLRSLRERKQ